MNSTPKRLADFLSELAEISDRETRQDLLIELAEKFRPVPEAIAARPFPEIFRVPACESEAYVWCVPDQDGKPKFYFAVENPQGISAKAMAVILDENLSGEEASVIAQVPEDIVYKIFGREVTMGRGQGLMSMVSMAKAGAHALASKTKQARG